MDISTYVYICNTMYVCVCGLFESVYVFLYQVLLFLITCVSIYTNIQKVPYQCIIDTLHFKMYKTPTTKSTLVP